MFSPDGTLISASAAPHCGRQASERVMQPGPDPSKAGMHHAGNDVKGLASRHENRPASPEKEPSTQFAADFFSSSSSSRPKPEAAGFPTEKSNREEEKVESGVLQSRTRTVKARAFKGGRSLMSWKFVKGSFNSLGSPGAFGFRSRNCTAPVNEINLTNGMIKRGSAWLGLLVKSS